MNAKQCTKCKTLKHVSEFNKSVRARDNLQSWCKPCQKTWQAYNRKRNRAAVAAMAARPGNGAPQIDSKLKFDPAGGAQWIQCGDMMILVKPILWLHKANWDSFRAEFNVLKRGDAGLGAFTEARSD